MKSIHYAGDALMTGDVIADAVVRYAAALARENTSRAIDIPVRFEDGSIRVVNFLLGPASQIVAIPVEGDNDLEEVIDEGVVVELRQREAELGIPAPQGDDEVLSDYDPNELDL